MIQPGQRSLASREPDEQDAGTGAQKGQDAERPRLTERVRDHRAAQRTGHRRNAPTKVEKAKDCAAPEARAMGPFRRQRVRDRRRGSPDWRPEDQEGDKGKRGDTGYREQERHSLSEGERRGHLQRDMPRPASGDDPTHRDENRGCCGEEEANVAVRKSVLGEAQRYQNTYDPENQTEKAN